MDQQGTSVCWILLAKGEHIQVTFSISQCELGELLIAAMFTG